MFRGYCACRSVLAEGCGHAAAAIVGGRLSGVERGGIAGSRARRSVWRPDIGVLVPAAVRREVDGGRQAVAVAGV